MTKMHIKNKRHSKDKI